MSSKLDLINHELKGYSAAELAEVEKYLADRKPTLTIDLDPVFDRDFRKDGYELEVRPDGTVEDGELFPTLGGGSFTFDFVSFINVAGNEISIGGDEMRNRAVTMGGNLGQGDGQVVLRQAGKIPERYRGEIVIVLPRTVWVHRQSRRRFVPILCWNDGSWVMYLDGLSHSWYGCGRFLVPRKA
ncbi:MAG: hypothetical protein HZA94_03290 [Candidatus Vogelbacteria bacterium]|nr:hypothetical protein [Candidatus Vogelbacteria bacterium]